MRAHGEISVASEVPFDFASLVKSGVAYVTTTAWELCFSYQVTGFASKTCTAFAIA